MIIFISVPNTTTENETILQLHPSNPIELTCLSNGIPLPIISWYKDGINLRNGYNNVSIVVNGNMSILTVTDLRGQQGGEYICNGSNVAGMSSVSFIVECELNAFH